MDLGERISTLGRGCFGDVSCTRRSDGRVVAVKVFSAAVSPTQVDQEISVLQVVSSKSAYIVELVDQDSLHLSKCVVMEAYTGGPLNKHIQQSGQCGFQVATARAYASQLLSALGTLEELHCVHRDIKTSNCVLDHTGRLKLCDFGSAKILQASIGSDGERMRAFTITGTAHIMAPEMVAAMQQGYDHSVDYWALGAVLYELLTGGIPPLQRTCRGGGSSRPSSRAAGRPGGVMDNVEVERQGQWPDAASRTTARLAMALCAVRVNELEQESKSDTSLHDHTEEQEARARGEWFIENVDVLFVAKRGASANRNDGGFGMTERERREYGNAVDLVRDLLTVDPIRRLQALKRRIYTPPGDGTRDGCARWSKAVRGHPFFAAVDWLAVDAGISPPADPNFDRRLGCMELLAEHDDDEALTAAQQALFEGF